MSGADFENKWYPLASFPPFTLAPDISDWHLS